MVFLFGRRDGGRNYGFMTLTCLIELLRFRVTSLNAYTLLVGNRVQQVDSQGSTVFGTVGNLSLGDVPNVGTTIGMNPDSFSEHHLSKDEMGEGVKTGFRRYRRILRGTFQLVSRKGVTFVCGTKYNPLRRYRGMRRLTLTLNDFSVLSITF